MFCFTCVLFHANIWLCSILSFFNVVCTHWNCFIFCLSTNLGRLLCISSKIIILQLFQFLYVVTNYTIVVNSKIYFYLISDHYIWQIYKKFDFQVDFLWMFFGGLFVFNCCLRFFFNDLTRRCRKVIDFIDDSIDCIWNGSILCIGCITISVNI